MSAYLWVEHWNQGDLTPSIWDMVELSRDYGGNTGERHSFILVNPKTEMKISAQFPVNYDYGIYIMGTQVPFPSLDVGEMLISILSVDTVSGRSITELLELYEENPELVSSFVRFNQYDGSEYTGYPLENPEIGYWQTLGTIALPQITRDRVAAGLTPYEGNIIELLPTILDNINDGDWSGDTSLNPDPYTPDGSPSIPSTPGGGGGSFDPGTGDYIGLPSVPGIGGSDCGLWTIYTPTPYQLNSLADYLWNPTFEQQISKIFSDPMQSLIGLTVVPFSVPASANAEIKVGNTDTGVYAQLADSRYMRFTCGSITVPAITNSYLDYQPHTAISIFLPYCGSHDLDINECSGATLSVDYTVDIITGACVACVSHQAHGVLYQFTGNCGMTIPLSSLSHDELLASILTGAGALVATVASGGAAAPASVGVVASATVNALKEHVQKSGNVTGVSGWLGVQKPYLTMHFPNVSIPAYQNSISGYPSNIYARLGDLRGYTEIEKVDMVGIPATAEELEEIERLLQEGVYL